MVNYIQYDRHPKNFYDIDIKAIDYNSQKKRYGREKEKYILSIDFGDIPEKLEEEYLGMYEGIQSEILSTMRFNENSDLITTYLGKIGTTRARNIKVEEKFPISEQGYAVGRLLDDTECQILLDTEASKLFMSKSHMHCKSLHSLPKFASKTQRI